jgi:hypothetical protein
VSGDEDDESRHSGHGRMVDCSGHGFHVEDGHRTDILMRWVWEAHWSDWHDIHNVRFGFFH